MKRSGLAILVIALGAAALVSGRTDGLAAGVEKRWLEDAVPLPVSPPAAEDGEFIRRVWLHPGLFGPEESAAAAKMNATFEGYVRAGIDSVFILVKSTSGHVYFRSTAGVADPAYTYDFFGVFLREARRRNLTVHPWFCVFTEGAGVGEIGRHPEWLVRGPTEPFYGFDERSRELFAAETGADPLELKAKDTGNMMWAEWLRWNGRQVTLFIQEVREGLKSLGRPVRISAAVFPAADAAKIMIGQDWAEWVRTGLVDLLCPMLYTNSDALFETYAREAVALRTDRCRVCLGIGIETSHNRNTPEGMAGQIKISREAGADGVVFFSGSSLSEPFLKRLEADRVQHE